MRYVAGTWPRGLGVVLALALAGPVGASAEPTPIPEGPDAARLPTFIGASHGNPVRAYGPRVRRNPFMAPNGKSNLHDDSYQTDTYDWPGPHGVDMQKISHFRPAECIPIDPTSPGSPLSTCAAECASITFDSKGRLVTICVGLDRPTLVVLDPRTLDQLASMALPPRPPGGTGFFTDFSGGGYFYLDHKDRAVFGTNDRRMYVVAVRDGPSGVELVKEHDYDLTAAVPPGDKIISALPDWGGRLWIATTNGVVATLDTGSGALRSMDLAEPNGNSFAVGPDGVYIVTDAALYRFEAAADGSPRVVWRQPYANIGERKSGQTQAGSGTTPTLMGERFVTITDNADPMNVVVYRRERTVQGSREVCRQPVFEKGASSTDQSLIAAGRSIIVENNHGYTGPGSTQNGGTTSPGIERVDLDRDGVGCRTVWKSAERSPSVVPKVSLASGLVYTYTKDPQPDDSDAWYFTAIDLHSGRTVYKRLGGEGLGHNNNFAPVTIGPDGTVYIGVLGGLIRLADSRPPQPGSDDLRLHARPWGGDDVRLKLVGRGTEGIRRVAFFVEGRRRHDSAAPFRRVFGLPRGADGSEPLEVRATVRMNDGRLLRLERTLVRR